MSSAIFVLLILTRVILGDLVLESTLHTNWGVWGPFENCTYTGNQVIAFQLKTESWQGDGDDTALNGIRFYCGDPRYPSRFNQNITSTVASWGTWGQVFQCGFGQGEMVAFQMNVETYQGSDDDTATNNLRIKCTTHESAEQFLQGDGRLFGLWREIHHCPENHAICGIQTQVEPWQGDGSGDDDTALNNIRVKCCQH